MNYWVLAWLILHSHCQKSPSSRAANSHQASFRRTLLPCSYTHPRPPFSSSVCTLWDVQLISDGPPAGPTFPSSSDSLKPRSLPLWTLWCLCVSLQENKAHTHTHVSSSNLSWHLFIFQTASSSVPFPDAETHRARCKFQRRSCTSSICSCSLAGAK